MYNMDELEKYESQLLPISDNDFAKAQEKLMKNMKQKSFYREKQFIIYENDTISMDYTGENLRRSYYKNTEMQYANLTNVGFSGSIFVSTSFTDCVLDNTKLDFCELYDCKFLNSKNNEVRYLNFNQSIICKSQFYNLNMLAANFTDTIFENVIFKDCVWKSLCLEGAVFRDTSLDNVKLHKLNFEFSFFDNIKMNNIRLPFPTIPYVFNGLKYLMETSDRVVISSAASESGSISIDEYLNYLDDLIIFYTKTQNFFPLANIYIAKKEFSKAYSAIIAGVKFSMMNIRNFRLVYYFCKLLQSTKEFTIKQRSYVYNLIINFSDLKSWRPIDYYNFSYYIDKIRNTLLNENPSDFLTFTLNTNILSKEYEKVSCLYQVIESIIELIEKEKRKKVIYYLEIRHNSPFDFFVKVFSDPETLTLIFEAISLVCMGIEKLTNYFKEKKAEKMEREKLSTLKRIETELEAEKINFYKKQNELLILQNDLLQQQLELQSAKLEQNSIVIYNLNSHISNYNL